MNHPTLKFACLHAGVLAALLLGACGGDEATPSGSKDPIENDDSDSSDDGAKASKDAGTKKDAGKDAGKTVAADVDSGAGGKVDAGTGPKATGELPCAVKAVLESNCSMCHGKETAYGAPMSLFTLADFQGKATTGASLTAQVKKRINDTNANTAMPPSTGTKLTDAQLKTLNDWIDGGAGAGDGASCGSGAGTVIPVDDTAAHDTSGLDCYKMVAHGDGDTKFKVGTAVDAYFNFTFTAPWTTTSYGVLFNPIIDNKKALHHFLLFQNNKTSAPTGGVKSSGAHPDGQLVYGWAPGGPPLDFRDAIDGVDVGFELLAGVSYTVEYHYNSSDPAAMDASGVEICLDKNKPANIAAISWLGYDNLLVPSTTWTGQCVPENKEPVHIIGVQPHMHVKGKHMKAVIHRKGGADEVLHDEPFDFNNQVHYMKNVVINPGDSITTTCEYTQPMAFGESTGQEMCYLFTYAYAKGQLKDSGPWGATAHGGSACLGQ